MTSTDTFIGATNGDVGRRLEELLHGLIAKPTIKHAVLAVKTGDGSFRWHAAAGNATASGNPMTLDTPYLTASVTKLYTAATVMRLVEDRHLELDAPIAAYLPHGYSSGIHRRKGVDAGASLTVRQLLGHTSGLPNYFEDRRRGERSLSERLFREGDRAFSDEEALRLIRTLPAHFTPQPVNARRVRYSDTNYWLLGVILETITSKPLERVFAELLFRPLNLRHTYLYGRSEPRGATEAHATLWVNDLPMEFPRFMASHAADGGLVATARDTIAFMRALTQGGLFRDPKTLARMQERYHRFGFPTDAAALRAPSWPVACGLGMLRFALPRLFTGFWRMPAVIGHTGSTGSWLFYSPTWDLYLAGTVDQVTAGAMPYRVVPRLLRILEPVVR